MSIFKRLFKIGQAEAHSVVDKLEDPIKLAEQGIRDMKLDLDKSLHALAEVKAMAIRSKAEVETHRKNSQEFESKAMMLLQRAQSGQMDAAEADRLAGIALQKKAEAEGSLAASMKNQAQYDDSVAKLETQVRRLKANITKWENEAKTLKARAKVSEATKNVNKQLANIDSSSTISMLERMKEKVEKQEALSEAYGNIADENKSVEEEIDSALGAGSGNDALAALKAKMGMLPPSADSTSTPPPPTI